MLLGSIEAGGTKFVCAVGNENYQVQDQTQFPTTTPEETLQRAVDYFKKFDIAALSIASFGPIEIRHSSPKYGYVTTTPKPGWADTDFVGYIKKEFDIPIFWTTDVNGSAYGEYVMATLANEKNQFVDVLYNWYRCGCGSNRERPLDRGNRSSWNGPCFSKAAPWRSRF